MKLKPCPRPRFLWILPWLAGCGFGAEINQAITGQEDSLEATACEQIVSHSDLIVSTLQGALPAAAMELQLPNSTCELSLDDTPTKKTLDLTTKGCAIDTPSGASAIGLQMSVAALSLAATAASAGAPFTLSGSGELDITANLPIIGKYTGALTYTLGSRSSFDPNTGVLDLDLSLAYKSGPSLLPIAIAVSGTRSSITGTMTGPSLSCTVSGSLDAPVIACP